MELRWTQEAAADLDRIADYLFEHTPDRAERLVHALYDAPATLLMFPNRGQRPVLLVQVSPAQRE